jgi:hypothetical protein
MERLMKVVCVVVVLLCGAIGVAHAQSKILLDEVVGSWQGDDDVQYVELRMTANDQNAIANVAAVIFDDASASAAGQRVAIFPQNVTRGLADTKILIASTKARDLAGVTPDFLLPNGWLHPKDGRVCYAVSNGSGYVPVDCVAYGDFTGNNGQFGPPTPLTPDNRALQRAATKGRNRTDWTSVLAPVLENNAGNTGNLPVTHCGDGLISQGEVCDGDNLGGATCAALGFAKGKLACTQCHYDTDACTACGNDAINGKEECDGGDLGERTCETLGYTGGELKCTSACKLDLTGCDGSFFVAGGGPPKTDCLGEWLVTNTVGGPNLKGKTAPKQTCKDGTAGCDADGKADGTCTFTLAPCFSRADARLAKCPATAISEWTLLGKVDPADPAVIALVAAVGGLGTSTTSGVTVTFSPALAEANACTASIAVPVTAGSKLVLRARTSGPSGKPKDADVLKLVCTR